MRKSVRTLFLGAVLFSAAAAAIAQPSKLTVSPKNLTIIYDASAESYGTDAITLTLGKNISELNYFITFDPTAASRTLTNGTNSINYNIYDAPTAPRNVILDWTNAATTNDVLHGMFPGLQGTAPRDAIIVLTPGGFAPAGSYTGTITANFYSGVVAPVKSSVLEASNTFTVKATVDAIAAIKLTAVGGNFDSGTPSYLFNFGTLTDVPVVKTADLVARANTTYTLAVSSANSNVMYHKQGDTTSTIAYVINIAGTNYTNLTPTPFTFTTITQQPTTAVGRNYTITITTSVPTSQFPAWGDYEDTISFTITVI